MIEKYVKKFDKENKQRVYDFGIILYPIFGTTKKGIHQ